MRHGTAIRSAALAFFTVMSLVPILAIAFAVAKGFGMENYLTQLLYEQLPDYRSVIDILMGFVNNLLGRTRGGVMAIGAFMVLIWAVIQVFGNVEKAFNNIWEVKNTRSMARRFGVYLGVVIMVPLLLVASYTIMIGVRSRLGVFNDNMAVGILFELLSLTAVVSVFTLIYDVIPNTKVRFSNALIAGTVTGVIFYLFQILYFFIQRELGSYNAIYGAFAAIPLFLLWMQINWQIVLFGGELSFGLQNVSSYEQELLSLSVSYDYRCKIMLASMVIILRDYLDDKPSLASSGTIAHELQLPIRIIRDVMHELEKDGLVFFVENEKDEKVNNYVPAVDPRSLRLIDVVSRVTASGIELKKGKTEAPLMEKVGRIYDKVKHDFTQLPENVYLTDLIEGVDGRDADGGRNAVGGRDADTGLNVDSGRNAGGEINSEKNA
jgi:membrane protein